MNSSTHPRARQKLRTSSVVQILLTFASVLVFVICAAAQSSSIDTKLAAQYFQQLKQTSDRDGGKTWGL